MAAAKGLGCSGILASLDACDLKALQQFKRKPQSPWVKDAV